MILGKNTKTVFDWILGSAKKRQYSKKGKRPLSSSNIPAPKYSRLLKVEGEVCFVQVRIRVSCFFWCILYMYNRLSGEDVFQPVIQAACKKIQVLPA